jgi:transcriptional regulator with XRE-family HTH domain/Zn-dependent peptidase ImmA (M78 family)
MSNDQRASWEVSGYADITSATIINGELEVSFANGDTIHIDPIQLGVNWVNPDVQLNPEEGLSITFVGEGGQERSVDWMHLRSATDVDFAREVRNREAEQSRRLGLRLKALREDLGISQQDLARISGMSGPQLSRIESGSLDLRVSTIQSLLRAMNSSFADIAGPDAPEISQRSLSRIAIQAGVARDFMERILIEIPRDKVMKVLSQAFGWSTGAIASGIPGTIAPKPGILFKTVQRDPSVDSPMIHMAQVVSEVVDSHTKYLDFEGVPSGAIEIREQLISESGITLESLSQWMWRKGIPVVPLQGKGAFCAAVWKVDGKPVVTIKETRAPAVFWLFDLAHELGHIALGHVEKSSLVDIDGLTSAGRNHTEIDGIEARASQFATELLLGKPDEILSEVRTLTRNNYLRFKNAVSDVATRHGISPGLLGMIAAFEMDDIGEPKDRWGSATNLAKADGKGRDQVLEVFIHEFSQELITGDDRLLLKASVFNSELTV